MAIIFVLNSAYAAINIVLPVEAKLANGSEIEFGNIAQGETLKVVVQKKSDSGFNWDNISASVPENWKTSLETGDKTIVLEIKIPRNAMESIQLINFSLSSDVQPLAEESFSGILTVKKNLLTVAIGNLNQSALVGQTVSYNLVASNDSIAKNSLRIESSLPNYWFEPVVIALEPKQKKEMVLYLAPKTYGVRNFYFFAKSQENDFSKEFIAELNINSTFAGKFAAAAYAFPFFTLSNMTFYVANSLLAMPFA